MFWLAARGWVAVVRNGGISTLLHSSQTQLILYDSDFLVFSPNVRMNVYTLIQTHIEAYKQRKTHEHVETEQWKIKEVFLSFIFSHSSCKFFLIFLLYLVVDIIGIVDVIVVGIYTTRLSKYFSNCLFNLCLLK